MKKLRLLTKTLLVAAGLCMGATSAWAAEMTTMTGRLGATNNTDGLMANHSKHVTLAANDSYVYKIVNNQAGSGDFYKNWAIEFRGSDWGTEYATFRADGLGWGAGFTSIVYAENAYSGVTDWMSKYNGANVTITVSRSADGTGVTIVHTSDVKDDSDNNYGSTFSFACDADETITFYLGYEAAWIDILSVNYNNTNLSYASSESAYVDQDNSTMNYNGASLDNLYIRNTQYRDWGTNDGTANFKGSGKLSLYKFDLTSIKNKLSTEGGTITGVSFSVYGKSSDASKAVTNVRTVGYNPAWSSSTVTQSNLTNNVGTISGTVSDGGSFQPLNDVEARSIASAGTTLTENALTYVNSAIAANNDYVTIAVMANLGRDALMNTVATLTFTYSAAVLYEATFTEDNSLNPDVTVYSDNERTAEVAKNELEANTTYYFKAVLAGYEDYEGSFDVTTSNPTVNFTMTAKPRYTFTVNAVNSDGGATIQALYTDDDSYDGKAHRVYFPAYLTGASNVVTYSKTNSTYYADYVSASGDPTKTQSYSAYAGNAWFYEGENVEGRVEYTTGTFAPRSSSGSTGVLSEKTITNLAAGSYKISARVIGKADNTMSMYKTSKSGEKIFDVKTSTSGAMGVGYITLDAATDIVADGGFYTTSDNGYGFDYILIEEVTSVSKTITAAGWATYCSPYALDFSSAIDNLDAAYIVTGGADGVLTKEAVTTTVAAGTGLLLKGNAGTVNIPVAASGTDYSATNILTGVTSNTVIAAEAGWVLMGSPSLGFYQNSGEFTVGANTAYIPVAKLAVPAGARPFFSLDGDATGISAALMNKETMNNEVYNLKGQRVSQPTKGLYIVNGKKVVIK